MIRMIYLHVYFVSYSGHCKRSLRIVGPVRMLQLGSFNLLIMDK